MLHFVNVRENRVTMSAKQERRNLWLAVLASLLLHVVVGLSLAAFNGGSMPLPVEDKPVELTIVDLSADPATLGASQSSLHGNRRGEGIRGAAEGKDLRIERELDRREHAAGNGRCAAAIARGKGSALCGSTDAGCLAADRGEAGCPGKAIDASTSAHGSTDRDRDTEAKTFRYAKGNAGAHGPTPDDAGA